MITCFCKLIDWSDYVELYLWLVNLRTYTVLDLILYKVLQVNYGM